MGSEMCIRDRYYGKQGILKSVDGTKPMDEVFSAIVGILGE